MSIHGLLEFSSLHLPLFAHVHESIISFSVIIYALPFTLLLIVISLYPTRCGVLVGKFHPRDNILHFAAGHESVRSRENEVDKFSFSKTPRMFAYVIKSVLPDDE